jgi:glycosyl transferase family 25
VKAFIINLPKEEIKRGNITKQCANAGIEYDVINAIYGKNIAPEITSTLTYNYPACNLTLGEIGCALSHLHIYARMVSERIPYALILEDDSLFSNGARVVLDAVSKVIDNNKPEIFLLNTPEAITPVIKKRLNSEIVFYRMARSCQSSAYILNFQAAKKILNYNLPIKIESDGWTTFRDYCGVRTWCLENGVIESYDEDKSHSSLEEERALAQSARSHYASKFRKTQPGYKSKRLFNLLLKKISHRVILER